MFQFGVGVRQQLSDPEQGNDGPVEPDQTAASWTAMVAIPVSRTSAVGVRASISQARTSGTWDWGMQFYDEYRYRERPVEGGLVVVKRIGRVSLEPWVGIHSRRRTVDIRGCGPFVIDQPRPEHPCGTFQNVSMMTDWSPVRPIAGLGVNVDIVRVGGATIGAMIEAQYTPDFSSVGADLVFRI